MGMQYIERELRKVGRPGLADVVKGVRKEYGADIPLPQSTSEKPSKTVKEAQAVAELDLEVEWKRQSSNFVNLGYHRELGLTEEKYLASLPKFEPRPEEYQGRFDAPMLIETRIPWEKQAQLADIAVSEYLKARIAQTVPADEKSQAPESAYTGWFNKWGQRFPKPIKPFDARSQLAEDEVGGSPFDSVALQVHNPEVVKSGKYFDAIGYSVGSGHVPDLYDWGGRPGLDARWGDDAYDNDRPIVRGRKIVTK